MLQFKNSRHQAIDLQGFPGGKALMVMAFVLCCFLQTGYSQPYNGPESGSISNGALVSTDAFKNAVGENTLSVHPRRFFNPFPVHSNPGLADDALNNTPAAAPIGSREYNHSDIPRESTTDPPAVLLNFDGPDQSGGFPPDAIMAAGPDHVLVAVNSEFAIYDKQGNLLFSRNADVWLSNVLPYFGTFDPIVFYDNIDERWVQIWDLQNGNSGWWLISVSDDSNPMGTWINYAFPAHLNGTISAGNWGDHEQAGYDHQAVYVSGRQFGFDGFFDYCKMRIIPKSELYDITTSAVNYTDFWNFRDPNNVFQLVDGPPIAAKHLDDSNGNKAYIIVDSPYNTSTFITLWELNDPLGSPTLTGTNISLSGAGQPPNGQQSGGAVAVDAGRRVYRYATYRDGKLWTTCSVAGGAGQNFGFARYVQLDVANHTVLEDFTFGENNNYYLFPSMTPDGDGNVIAVFGISSNQTHPGSAVAGRRVGDAPGTMSPPVTYKEGEATYQQIDGNNRNRWGDYMGIALDPAYPSIVWGVVEYADSPANSWATRVGAFSYEYYGAGGSITESGSGNPLQNVRISFDGISFGNTQSTANGSYTAISPEQDVTLVAELFGYETVSMPLNLTLNDTQAVDITMNAKPLFTVSGQVKDILSGNGIEAEILFFAQGNPDPNPIATIMTDPNGNYSVNTILATYDVEIRAVHPYPSYSLVQNLVIDPGNLNINFELNPAEVILVDDDEGSDYENYYITALRAINVSYQHWEVASDGVPPAAELAKYSKKIAIWYTGDGANTLDANEQAEIEAHLNSGGHLFLTGQNIVEHTDGATLMNTLGVSYNGNMPLPIVSGVQGDFTEGLQFVTNGTAGANNQTSRDRMTISNAAQTRMIFFYGSAANIAGVAYDNGASKSVLLGYGYEAINSVQDREAVMDSVINFLQSPLAIDIRETGNGIPERYELSQNYPNPFNPTTRIRFSLPAASNVALTIYNTLGERVQTLVNQRLDAGTHEVTWDGKNAVGERISSGIYYYRINAGNQFVAMKKMILLK